MIDFRNVNTLWASVLVETFHRCGVIMAVVCPGSRSTPLTVAFVNHPQIAAIPILDERSAAFFALGRAKKTGLPTVLVCTSGTAGANFYPAVIEAQESGIPLVILTADRPAELRHCHAGQAIDQLKLYGNYPNWQVELALPEASFSCLRYLRQTIVQAWQQSLLPTPGVVHLNQPFREPLAPISQDLSEIKHEFPTDFFDAINSDGSENSSLLSYPASIPWHQWQKKTGIIIAGLAQPQDPVAYCQAIACLAQELSFPVFAEALSPLRNYAQLNPCLISTYDAILRQPIPSDLMPEVVIQVGELPISKQLRSWLEEINVERWIIDARTDNLDPLHGKTVHLPTTIEQVAASIEPQGNIEQSAYCQGWLALETRVRDNIDRTLTPVERLYEGKVAWLLSQTLPSDTPIFLANSMSVRYAEYFWQPNQKKIAPYFSRGANGIDGTLSTALGIAYQDVGVLLTGDLALLHDTNGFLLAQKFQGHLTIVLINNNGGGIFEILPIADFPPFEEYFATPQTVNISQLCAAYAVEHIQIDSWQQLTSLTSHLPQAGIRVLEVICDRHTDATWLKENLPLFGK
ncbi:MAG: 2-succinyl-5-enolpyruvyl-6-hydroxy-3-cyclohexene-1-carboxylic-acid synthase [Cyanobacteria bacterium J06607_15]